jgi:hypothetical protein
MPLLLRARSPFGFSPPRLGVAQGRLSRRWWRREASGCAFAALISIEMKIR